MEINYTSFYLKDKKTAKNKEILSKSQNCLPYIDMHTHSIYYDGELEPNQLFKEAIKNNVGTIAITDHDTLLGNKNILYGYNHKETRRLHIINGIELSAKVDRGRMHILGYDFDINDFNLNKKMTELRTNSLYSVLALINQIKKDYNIIFSVEDIQEIINNKGNIGRPHLAKLLVKYKYAKDINEAFSKYLVDAYNKTKYSNKGIKDEECISLIKKAKGLAVLAHPNQLKMTDFELEDTLKKLIYYGLDGIEVYHSSHTKDEVKKYLTLANKYNLLISGGSDYHGKHIKPDILLGSGINGTVKIKQLSLLDHIKNR